MATIQGKTNHVQHSVLQTVWDAMGAADVGTAEQLSRYPNKSLSVTGVPGGATFVLQGSDDGINWFTVNDVKGNAISTVAAARYDIVDVPEHIRPSTSGGGGTTNLKAILTSRSFGR